MPNYCKNILVVAGQPESVEEFRIIQGQHTEALENEDLTKSIQNPAADALSFDALVRHRYPNDLSFAALVRNWGEDAWGTSNDVAGNSKHERQDRGGWRTPADDALFDRLQSWTFNTTWSPPEIWLQFVATRFPDLNFQLGYSEPGTNCLGIASAQGSQWSVQPLSGAQEAKPEVDAMSNARRAMPLHRKPPKLLKAIWADDAGAVGSFLRQSKRMGSRSVIQALDSATESTWSALMHAAYSGSKGVASLLLKEGASPFPGAHASDTLRAGFSDICMDVHGHMTDRLVKARQSIFLQAMSIHPSLGSVPLASGRLPLALAMRYQMSDLIAPLAKATPGLLQELEKAGKNAHDEPALLMKGLLKNARLSAVGSVLEKLPPEVVKVFGASMVMPLLKSSSALQEEQAQAAAAVLGDLSNHNAVQAEHWRIATGEDSFDDGSGARKQMSDDFRAMATAIRAKAAMAGIAEMGRQRRTSPA